MDYWFNESKTDFCFQNRLLPSRTLSMRRKQGPPAGAVAAAGGLVEKKSKTSKKEPFSPVGENPRRARLREIRFCGGKQTSQPREFESGQPTLWSSSDRECCYAQCMPSLRIILPSRCTDGGSDADCRRALSSSFHSLASSPILPLTPNHSSPCPHPPPPA